MTKKVIDWYGGTSEDRDLMRWWVTLGLPIEHCQKGYNNWLPLRVKPHEVTLTTIQHIEGGYCFYKDIRFRLKPHDE